MTEAEKQAFAIYEKICASSAGRPASGNSLEQLMRDLGAWREKNPGLEALRGAELQVRLAFLGRSLEWLRAEARDIRNMYVCSAVSDGIQLAFAAAPKPLPVELASRLLAEYQDSLGSLSRIYFPFEQLLSLITPDQVTDEIRAHLKKLSLQFSPSPTGKIDPGTRAIRERILELARVEGEKQLDPGLGPWTQIVYDEIMGKEEIERSGWEGLLKHCRSLAQTVPGAKWKKRSRELVQALGEGEATPVMLGWLARGPTPGQPSEARSPIEDSACQKGVIWCLGMSQDREVAVAIADFGIACLRKIPMLGAVSQKVGFACVQALGAMECSEAVSQLTRLRAKVRYSVARRLIEKSLQQAAERSGLTIEELEDMSVANYGLDAKGAVEIPLGDAKATVRLSQDGSLGVAWENAAGKLVKSAPSHIKKAFAKEVRSVSSLAKELEQAYQAQRLRLESSFVAAREMPLAHWQKYFIEHQLLGLLGRNLIWVFSHEGGRQHSGLWWNHAVRDSSGNLVDLSKVKQVRLWHPLSSDASERQQWREQIFRNGIRQPFRQAFREFYQVTADERKTRMHSNRFAGVLMRQHQLASLCRVRGWDYRLMGVGFDGFNVPTRNFPAWNIHVEFYVDLPPDRDRSLHDSALGEQSGSGINLFIGSDQVKFYRDRKEVAVDQVPAIVYSEVMRDVDLFTSVCAVGDDESWSDQGDRGTGILSDRFDLREFSAITELRAEVLTRVLPHTPIAAQCKIEKDWLHVQGQLGKYHIPIGWSGAALITDSGMRWLKIPHKILASVALDLDTVPIDLDYRTEMVLRRAYVLANDWKIDLPELIRQLMPD